LKYFFYIYSVRQDETYILFLIVNARHKKNKSKIIENLSVLRIDLLHGCSNGLHDVYAIML